VRAIDKPRPPPHRTMSVVVYLTVCVIDPTLVSRFRDRVSGPVVSRHVPAIGCVCRSMARNTVGRVMNELVASILTIMLLFSLGGLVLFWVPVLGPAIADEACAASM
jgi:hypothetical protein